MSTLTLPNISEDQGALSKLIIPAVPGEYYAYLHEFTKERPVFALLKCKANKARPVEEAAELGMEANAFFQITDTNTKVLSIKAADAYGLLDCVGISDLFGETWFAPVKLTPKEFHEFRACKDAIALVEMCQEACSERGVVVDLKESSVVAMMTEHGKYGMFVVQEINSTSIQIAACHILL